MTHRLPDIRTPERILVIRVDLLGDVMYALWAVKSLRTAYPRAHLVMLTLPYTACARA